MSAPGMPLRDVLARWDRVVLDWDLDPYERSLLVGGFRGGPVDQVETYELVCGEMRMRLLVELAPVLRRVHGDDVRIRAWLRRESAELGGRTPMEVMARSPEWISWLLRTVGLGA